jgi:hypothetical protein
MALGDVPRLAVTSKGLSAHAAIDTLWRAIVQGGFSHLTTTFALLPAPKPLLKSLVRSFVDARRATAVSEPPQPTVPAVTLDDYIFHYDVLIDGEIRELWVGKADFEVLPGATLMANVVLPLTKEGVHLVNDKVCRSLEELELRRLDDVPDIDCIRLRVTVLEVATPKTAVITSETQRPFYMEAEDTAILFRDYPIAHWLPVEVVYNDHYLGVDEAGEVDRVGEVEVQAILELHSPEILADPSTIDNDLLRLEFKWTGTQFSLPITQNELLLVFQNGAIFKYRTFPPALA